MFDGWYENDQRILEFPKTINKNHTYEARWAEDKNGNQVPDKYDAKVTFRATNGLFEGGKETIVQEYVLAEIKDGVWTPVKKVLGSIPKAVANEGFENGTWVKHTPTAETQVVDGAEYTIEFAQIKRKLKINYVDENGMPINKDIFHETELNYGESYSIEFPDFKGYVLENQNQAIITGTMDYENIEINVVYLSDKNSDSIPDKYQVRVDYEAVNGSVSIDHTYVTLFDEDGKWSEDGIGHLTEAQIPTTSANDGSIMVLGISCQQQH